MSEGLSTVGLDELVELRPEKVASNKDPNLPYIGLEHIAQGQPHLLGSLPSSASVSINCCFSKDDILFGKLRPNLRKSLKVPFAGYCSTDIIVLRARDGVLPSYAAHVFQWERVFAAASATAVGTKMPRTSWNELRRYRVFKTDSDIEQSRIAAVLDTVSEAIAKTETVIAKLRQVRAGLLHDLLTRGLDHDGQLRDHIAHPEQFQNSPLGRIPRDWEANIFVEEVALRHGYQFRDHDFVPTGFPIVKITAVSPLGYLDLSETTYFAIERADEFRNVELYEGDILMSLTGNIGRCVKVPVLQTRIFQNYRVGKFEPLVAERWDKAFLFVLLSSFVVYDQITRRANLTAQANIGKEEFEGIYLPVPHPTEQKAIAAVMLSHDLAIRAEVGWAQKLRAIKSGLMTDLLTGRVRVPLKTKETA